MVAQSLGLVKLLSWISANIRLLSPPFSKLSDNSQGNVCQSLDLSCHKSHMQNMNTDKSPRSWPSAMEVLGNTEHSQI